MEVKIKFTNGVVITAELNGNCFITDDQPAFPADLRNIVVEGEGERMEFQYAQVVECASIDGRYWFTFVEMPEATQLDMVEAQALYTALMTDTLLPEEE